MCSFADPAVAAANAVAARDAAAARFLLSSEALAKCREDNNPYNQWGLGFQGLEPTWAVDAPDPCREAWKAATSDYYALQSAEKTLAGATTTSIDAAQASQRSNAPSSQDLASAPAPQLATSGDPVGITDPAIPISEYTVPEEGMECSWSPSSIEAVMEQILEEMEAEPSERSLAVLEEIESNMRAAGMWWSWNRGRSTGIKWRPKNQGWVGRWIP